MNKTIKLTLALGSSLFILTGCMGPTVPTNNSAQTGAATGAVVGAVVGANTKGHNKGRRMALGAAIGAVAGGLIGNASNEQNPQSQQTGGWQ